MDPLRHVQPGERVVHSARMHNAMVDAAVAERTRRNVVGAESLTVTRDACIVRVKNETGINLDRYSVVGLSQPMWDPGESQESWEAFQAEVMFRGIVPAAGVHDGKFAILLEPAMTNAVVRAYVCGVVQARVVITDDKLHCVDVTDGSTTTLTTREDGSAYILWSQIDDTYGYSGYGGAYPDERWAIIRFGTPCGVPSTGTGQDNCCGPKDDYLVNVRCPEDGCEVMPKYWILTIVDSRTKAYEDDCDAVPCIEVTAGNQVTLENPLEEYGAYYDDDCLWTGEGNRCTYVELEYEPDNHKWRLRIWDTDNCLMANYVMDESDFNCCGLNTAWRDEEYDDQSHCTMTLKLEPHPCTCCPEEYIEDECGCVIQEGDPDLGKATKMEFTVGGVVDGVPCNCSIINNITSIYRLNHFGPDTCSWVGGKTEADPVPVDASIIKDPASPYFYLHIESGCVNVIYRAHNKDFDCCHGGTFDRVTQDWRENPEALCALLPDTISVTGVPPCCD